MMFGKWMLSFSVISILFFACNSNEYKMADRYFEQGEYKKAIEQYNEYLEYQPTHVESMYNRGRAYEELGEFKKSLASYEEALEVDPKNVNALMSIGKYHFRNENYQDAAFYFDKASQIHKSDAKAHYLAGRAFHKSGKTKEAMDAYNSTISLDDQYGEAFLYRGALKVYEGKKSAGCEDFRLASALNVAEAQEAIDQYCN
ncbi:tetratricopeptide (TPR) repeat protein [Catalinimonas alkaloidigena]|uniref:tetratricopeptide repeat protein n=1 Tax=Catalinimonas alkaloidigena TaxID=1075417 RepID=UPI0024059ECD|nr:tetratricopeptide repeat protein [Catalinimonas alkaloidigena]MDF9797144.1 tetratricopeptide (TPR) repeat protein [Catalinimonas alkaloidigena]